MNGPGLEFLERGCDSHKPQWKKSTRVVLSNANGKQLDIIKQSILPLESLKFSVAPRPPTIIVIKLVALQHFALCQSMAAAGLIPDFLATFIYLIN